MHRLENVTAPGEGDLVRVEVDGKGVALTLDRGVLRAVDDECTHMQCSLAGGDVEDGVLVCPCHMGRFDLATGAVLGGPPEGPIGVWRVGFADGVLELDR
jgi:nitrite reductase/ring-hydroxylating ferredoxin subunit